jgi:hypothetical protein
MINRDNINYGVLYSFEPNFLKYVTREDDVLLSQVEEDATYHLDSTDTKWSGVLVILVFLLMLGLIASLTKTISNASITGVTSKNVPHILQHYS